MADITYVLPAQPCVKRRLGLQAGTFLPCWAGQVAAQPKAAWSDKTATVADMSTALTPHDAMSDGRQQHGQARHACKDGGIAQCSASQPRLTLQNNHSPFNVDAIGRRRTELLQAVGCLGAKDSDHVGPQAGAPLAAQYCAACSSAHLQQDRASCAGH